MDILLDDRTTGMDAGNAVIISPGKRHYYVYSANGAQLDYCWTHFTGSMVPKLIEDQKLKLDSVFSVSETEQLSKYFRELMNRFIEIDDWQGSEVAGYLMVLLSRLGRAAAGEDIKRNAAPIRRSLEYIDRHYSDQLTVSNLAAMEFMSPSRYSALFLKVTGYSPKDYLINIRMRNAAELLDKTDLPIKQIAAAVGYDDPLYFSRIFRNRTGRSPRKKRKQNETE